MRSFFQSLLDGLWAVIVWIATQVMDLLAWWWQFLKDFWGGVFDAVWEWAKANLPAEWIDAIDIDWSPYTQMYADIAWILPVNEFFGLVGGTFVLVGAMRLVRWVLSFLWITG